MPIIVLAYVFMFLAFGLWVGYLALKAVAFVFALPVFLAMIAFGAIAAGLYITLDSKRYPDDHPIGVFEYPALSLWTWLTAPIVFLAFSFLGPLIVSDISLHGPSAAPAWLVPVARYVMGRYHLPATVPPSAASDGYGMHRLFLASVFFYEVMGVCWAFKLALSYVPDFIEWWLSDWLPPVDWGPLRERHPLRWKRLRIRAQRVERLAGETDEGRSRRAMAYFASEWKKWRDDRMRYARGEKFLIDDVADPGTFVVPVSPQGPVNVVLTGRVAATPTFHATPSGVGVARFCVSVESSPASVGEVGEARLGDLVRVVALRGLAHDCLANLDEGRLVHIEGYERRGVYVDGSGTLQPETALVADVVRLVDPRRATGRNSGEGPPPPTDADAPPDGLSAV